MISVAEALERLTGAVAAMPVEQVALADALSRTLAEPVLADRDFPPTDRSAMDGYAVRVADFADAGATRLKLVGELRAGQAADALEVAIGQALRIMTGAIVPPGADAVVMVERSEEDAASVTVVLRDRPRRGQHIRRRGEELREGQTVLDAGTRIEAAEIAALASVGRARVAVHGRPRVHVLATGDEVVEPDRRPLAHQVRNSNAHALIAQLAALGLTGDYLGIATDDARGLDDRLQVGLAGDALLVTGGVSAGAYDLVGRVLADKGMELLFHGVAIKPGKPMLAGRVGGCLVLGLPGNPVSTFTCFSILVAPALRKMMGQSRLSPLRLSATLETPIDQRPGRETYHLARLAVGERGLGARLVGAAGSGDVLALARANGFIVTPADAGRIEAGSPVDVLPWRLDALPG